MMASWPDCDQKRRWEVKRKRLWEPGKWPRELLQLRCRMHSDGVY